MTFPINFPPMFGGLLPVFPGRPLVASGSLVGGTMCGISAAGAASAMSVASSQEAGGAKAKRGGDRPARRKVNVVMGIDFGTAFTKIAIRAPYEPGGEDTAYAVEFHKIPDDPCMLRSAVWIDNVDDDKKKFCWVEPGRGRKMYSGIKVEVIDPPHSLRPSNRALARAAAYLGIVIRGARIWFEKQKRFEANVDLDWHYQVGIPAATARCELAQKDYSRLANAALALSEFPKFSLWAAEKEIEREQGSRVDWIPEVIAQAYGYARDPDAAEGIYAMVDIGAWTLDACSFINQVRDTRIDLRAASVEPLGCLNLHQARMGAVGRAIMPDQFDPLPQSEKYCQQIEQNNAAVINRADSAFRSECAGIIGAVFDAARQKHQLRKMIEQRGLPVMICGGGSNIPLFKKAARQGWDEIRKAWQPSAEVRFLSLPKYRLIGRGINEKNIHRFSVAWGLSYPNIDYQLDGSPPPRLPQSDYWRRYTGAEQT